MTTTLKNGDNFDKKYCEGADKIGNDTYERYQSYVKNDNFKDVFRNYTFSNVDSKENEHSGKSPTISNHHRTPSKNISASVSNISINQSSSNYNLLNKAKIKISDSLILSKGLTKSTASLTPDKAAKQPLRVKHNSISGNQFNHFNAQQQNNQLNRYQSMIPSSNTPYKFKNEKMTDRLPFIDTKMSKSISKTKLTNSISSSRLTNSSSTNSIQRNYKFSTISANSTGVSGASSSNAAPVHKRSGSMNFIQY